MAALPELGEFGLNQDVATVKLKGSADVILCESNHQKDLQQDEAVAILWLQDLLCLEAQSIKVEVPTPAHAVMFLDAPVQAGQLLHVHVGIDLGAGVGGADSCPDIDQPSGATASSSISSVIQLVDDPVTCPRRSARIAKQAALVSLAFRRQPVIQNGTAQSVATLPAHGSSFDKPSVPYRVIAMVSGNLRHGPHLPSHFSRRSSSRAGGARA